MEIPPRPRSRADRFSSGGSSVFRSCRASFTAAVIMLLSGFAALPAHADTIGTTSDSLTTTVGSTSTLPSPAFSPSVTSTPLPSPMGGSSSTSSPSPSPLSATDGSSTLLPSASPSLSPSASPSDSSPSPTTSASPSGSGSPSASSATAPPSGGQSGLIGVADPCGSGSVCQQAETLINSCVAGTQPDCSLVIGEVDTAITLAVNCVNGSAPLCLQVEQAVQSLVNDGLADVIACVNGAAGSQGDPLGCHADVLTAEGLINGGLTLAEQCASGQNSTCALVERTALSLASEVEQCATGAAGGGSDPLGCHGVVVLAEQELAAVEALANSCASGSQPDCNLVIGEVDTAVTLAVNCVNGSAPLCEQVKSAVLALVDSGVADVVACVDGAAGSSGDPLGCHADVVTAEGLVNSGLTLAEQCASGQNSTCALAEHTLEGLASEAEQCATAAAFGGSDPLGCRNAVVLAEQELAAVEATAVACENQSNPTCATAIQTVQAVASFSATCVNEIIGVGPAASTQASSDASVNPLDCGALVNAVRTLVSDCVSGSDPNCATVLNLAQLIVNDVSGCAAGATDQIAPLLVSEENGDPVGCGTLVLSAENTITTEISAVQQCLDGTGAALCGDVIDEIGSLALELDQCASAIVNGGDDPLGCHSDIVLAEQTIDTAVAELNNCATGIDPNCATVINLAHSAADLVVGTIQDCAAGSGICASLTGTAQQITNLVLNTVEGCAGGTDPQCTQLVNELLGVINSVQDCLGQASSTCSQTLQGATQTLSDLVSSGVKGVGSTTNPLEPPGTCFPGAVVCGPPVSFMHDEGQFTAAYHYLVVVDGDRPVIFPLLAIAYWSVENGVVAQDNDTNVTTWFDNWNMFVYDANVLPFDPVMTDSTEHVPSACFVNPANPLCQPESFGYPVHSSTHQPSGQAGCSEQSPPTIAWSCFYPDCLSGAEKYFCAHEQTPLRETDSFPFAVTYNGHASVEPDETFFDDSSWVANSGDAESFWMGACWIANSAAIDPFELHCYNANSNHSP
jgi:hypothetical protein